MPITWGKNKNSSVLDFLKKTLKIGKPIEKNKNNEINETII